MRLHFIYKMSSYSKILRFFFVLTIYYFFTRFPYLFGYNMDLFPEINVRSILLKIHEVIYLSFFFNASIVALGASVVSKMISSVISLFYNEIRIIISKLVANLNSFNIDVNLDISNPFLYSYKTKALLE